MSAPQIRELDVKIDALRNELSKSLQPLERLIKIKELVSAFDKQNELLNQVIENNKKLWKQQQSTN